jgi:pyrroloquinoline quinone biosynthesis protein B
VIVRVLGSAAGGGVPQWNCACVNCAAARRGERPRRLQSSLAVSADGERWILLNVSPDIAEQIEAYPPLQPRGLRGTPIAGMLLTDANVDHIGGLVTLRQAGNHHFTVRSSRVVRNIATAQPAFAAFAQLPHRWLCADDGPLDALEGDPIGSSLMVRAIPVPGLTPGYAGRSAVRGAVTAYAVRAPGGRGGTLLFAPVFSAVDPTLAAEIRTADVAFLDGSFFTDNEMLETGAGDKLARSLGHAPLDGPEGTLATIGTAHRRCFVTHLNNTNPVLDPNSSAAAALTALNIEVAADGLLLEV